MALTEAQALAADLVALPWDDERIARAALEVTTALLAASPRVAWSGTHRRTGAPAHGAGVWWVDAAGLGSEAKLAAKLVTIAGGLGFGPARAGIAGSAIAAYAATYGGTRARGQGGAPMRPRIVPPGADARYLAPFPVTLLDLDDDLAGTLRGLGLATLGGLAALDADEVEARFGPEGLAAHRLARGLDSRGPTTPRDDALPAVEVEFGGPVATAEPLLFVLKGALASLGETLHTRGLAARELALALRLDDGSTAVRPIRPARPTSHPDALFDHCRLALETWQLPEPATGLALSAAVTVPASGEQGDLLAPRWADPAALLAAFERIRGSEGADAVALPEKRDGHLPADQGAWVEDTEARVHGRAQTHRGTDAPKPCPTSLSASSGHRDARSRAPRALGARRIQARGPLARRSRLVRPRAPRAPVVAGGRRSGDRDAWTARLLHGPHRRRGAVAAQEGRPLTRVVRGGMVGLKVRAHRGAVLFGSVRLCVCASMPPDYVELHCHSGFSLLDGASNPETLIARAAAIGMQAIALTDHDDLGGAVRWAEAGKEHGVGAIVGLEVTVGDAERRTEAQRTDAQKRSPCASARPRARAPRHPISPCSRWTRPATATSPGSSRWRGAGIAARRPRRGTRSSATPTACSA